jgi:2-hydroxy-3-oxopropionate reductase
MKIGFIGLGVMGLPMAGQVLAGGYDLTCFNRSRRDAAARGPWRALRKGCPGRSGGGRHRDHDAPRLSEVEQVVVGDDGVLAAMKPGALLIDCSTVHPATSRAVAAAASVLELSAVDAPVSGGEAGAVAGKLSVMAGGLAEDVDRARPVLGTFSASVQHVGGFGSGQTVKAANQLLVAGSLALLSEAIVFLESNGLDPSTALSAIAGGLAGSRCLDLKSPNMIRREFTPGFRTTLHQKDLKIAMDCASGAAVALPVTGIVAQLVASVCARGGGDLDHSAVLSVIAALSSHAPQVRP